jgi:hypothetical protein
MKTIFLTNSDLIEFISQFLELECERYFLEWILLLKIQTNNCKKKVFEEKNS